MLLLLLFLWLRPLLPLSVVHRLALHSLGVNPSDVLEQIRLPLGGQVAVGAADNLAQVDFPVWRICVIVCSGNKQL